VTPGQKASAITLIHPDGTHGTIPARVAVADVLEVAIPLASLGLSPGDSAPFCVKLLRGDIVLERHPVEGSLACPILPEEAVWQDWFV
jgi:hypothetical protein